MGTFVKSGKMLNQVFIIFDTIVGEKLPKDLLKSWTAIYLFTYFYEMLAPEI